MNWTSLQSGKVARRAARVALFAGALLLALWVARAQPSFSGKVTGGFQAPSSSDADGRRHVVKGKDMESHGKDLLELTEPHVTRYNPDDTPDMFIESARCFYQTKAGVAYSSTNLAVRTADGRFSIEGVGWHWDLSSSLLVISNRVAASVQKAALSNIGGAATNSARPATNTVHITSARFQQEGDAVSFLDRVVVKDGEDTLQCDRLNIQFVKPGGAQKIEAIQNVDLQQADTRIRSGHAIYDVKENIIRISDHPTWNLSRREGSADLLVLNRADETLLAEGHVQMRLPLTNLVLATGMAATNPPATNRFVDIASDRFTYDGARTNRAATAVYTGHVRALQADASLTCEKLTAAFASSNRLSGLRAEGNVKIAAQKNRVFGREADYDLERDKVVISGDPHWQLDQTHGRGDTLVFFPKSREIVALRNVEMIIPGRSFGAFLGTNRLDQAQNVNATNSPFRITADTLSHSENVSVFQKDVVVADARGTIDCALLTVYTGQSNQVQRIVAEGSVAIKQPDLVAFGERAEYDGATGMVRLTDEPELIGPDKRLRADVFYIDRNRNTFSVSPGKYRIELQLPKNGESSSRNFLKNPFATQ